MEQSGQHVEPDDAQRRSLEVMRMSVMVFLALLSALNVALHLGSRMIFSLAERGEAPRTPRTRPSRWSSRPGRATKSLTPDSATTTRTRSART